MKNEEIKQKMPSEVYDDWEKTIEAVKMVCQNAVRNNISSLPAWTINMSISEIKEITEVLARETDLQYSLGMISAIEGLFNHQIKLFVKRKRKDRFAKAIRQKFKNHVQEEKEIKFDDLLDTWKKNDPRTRELISKLKSILKYRNWLAHGRHWTIHYWNCPDPNDLFSLFEGLNDIIRFEAL